MNVALILLGLGFVCFAYGKPQGLREDPPEPVSYNICVKYLSYFFYNFGLL